MEVWGGGRFLMSEVPLYSPRYSGGPGPTKSNANPESIRNTLPLATLSDWTTIDKVDKGGPAIDQEPTMGR